MIVHSCILNTFENIFPLTMLFAAAMALAIFQAGDVF